MMESDGVRRLREAMKMAQVLGFGQRERRFNRASLYYWGRQYEHLEPWHSPGLPLREKRPSVQVGLTRKAVNKVNAHLFGEGHAPEWKIEDDDAGAEQLGDLVERSGLARRYSELGRLGCLHGTVAIGFFVFEGDRIDLEVMNVAKAKPTFGRDDRKRAIEEGIDFDELLELEEYWRELREDMRTGEETEIWHRRDWTTTETVEYEPIEGPLRSVHDVEWIRDDEATVTHDLGFVPAEWITPLEVTNDVDGAPIVEEADFLLEDEINYTLSQTGRGIRYNQEPTIVFTGVDVNRDDPILKGDGNTLMLRRDPIIEGGANADAKLLEMAGNGAVVSMEYSRTLRSLFNEIVQVVDHDPAQFAGALSGVALERLLYPMVLLVQNLRPDYEAKLGRLLEKMLAATGGPNRGDAVVTALWPSVVEPTVTDLRDFVSAVVELLELDIIDRQKVVELIAPMLDIDDVDAFLDQVDESLAEQGTTQTPAALAPSPAGVPPAQSPIPPLPGQTEPT